MQQMPASPRCALSSMTGASVDLHASSATPRREHVHRVHPVFRRDRAAFADPRGGERHQYWQRVETARLIVDWMQRVAPSKEAGLRP